MIARISLFLCSLYLSAWSLMIAVGIAHSHWGIGTLGFPVSVGLTACLFAVAFGFVLAFGLLLAQTKE